MSRLLLTLAVFLCLTAGSYGQDAEARARAALALSQAQAPPTAPKWECKCVRGGYCVCPGLNCPCDLMGFDEAFARLKKDGGGDFVMWIAYHPTLRQRYEHAVHCQAQEVNWERTPRCVLSRLGADGKWVHLKDLPCDCTREDIYQVFHPPATPPYRPVQSHFPEAFQPRTTFPALPMSGGGRGRSC